jgi:hypothetical protein
MVILPCDVLLQLAALCCARASTAAAAHSDAAARAARPPAPRRADPRALAARYDKYWGPLYRGVIPGTHIWALPIAECPIDHFLEVGMLDPVNTVREWSVLSNPRTPKTVTADVHHAAVDVRNAGEVARLAKLRHKVINITTPFVGLPEADIANQGVMLDRAQKKAFRSKFGFVSGSWCCAPMDELKKGAPRSAHFSLMTS